MSSKAESEAKPSNENEEEKDHAYEHSLTASVFVCWIIPVLIIALFSRFAVDTGPLLLPKPKPMNLGNVAKPSKISTTPTKPSRAPAQIPTLLADKPTSYKEAVEAIARRRLDWTSTSSDPTEKYQNPHTSQRESKRSVERGPTSSKPKKEPPPRGPQDIVRSNKLEQIEGLRKDYEMQPNDMIKAILLADALRLFDVQYHDGGTRQKEALETYQRALEMALAKRNSMIEEGEETNRSMAGTNEVNEEVIMDYTERSIDGILCAIYTSQGKTYFMANMFQMAVEAYTNALRIEPFYLDAMASRGSTRIILGEYKDAAQDFLQVMERDTARRFQDVYTGLSKILQAKESAVPGGWTPMVESLNKMIPHLEKQLFLHDSPAAIGLLSNTLNRFYHVLFLYHDVKTKDIDAAWVNLSKAYQYKMRTLPKWSTGQETQKVTATKSIFRGGFWTKGIGSQSRVPIFIIGFVRSGSTLLERVLDAHPQIAGMGENSVFNGKLEYIRNKIVEHSTLGNPDPNALSTLIESLADDVISEMQNRWRMVTSGDGEEPSKYVDKMLTNYYNVGFIHLLFPNALILHVAREPMDTIFSAYKHEFPSGALDYTSDFPSLAEMYHGYRDIMDHWDKELPGRVTHISYKDMVTDMPSVARRIIEATGLPWDDEVLDFHKKKHAVNTLSTTQVRKGVYTDSLKAWKRYEKHLQPLLKLIGERTKYDLRTTLPEAETV